MERKPTTFTISILCICKAAVVRFNLRRRAVWSIECRRYDRSDHLDFCRPALTKSSEMYTCEMCIDRDQDLIGEKPMVHGPCHWSSSRRSNE
ncbi:hypothetical protein ARMGADRAFT_287331 [Armillaria gallica]|uniref:Uncharacterized protein n=1 Tax=Armillaria gallica TaxID=47427 RepID=A0A2H3DPW1_ARMGA|nr:hypothetical protein ARMGADRAFT_287331 [Armillaria gallica]